MSIKKADEIAAARRTRASPPQPQETKIYLKAGGTVLAEIDWIRRETGLTTRAEAIRHIVSAFRTMRKAITL